MIYRRIYLSRFLPFCVQAKFWDHLIFPQILVIFKLTTMKIDFVNFLQIQVAFWKTNYTTFSYLLIPSHCQQQQSYSGLRSPGRSNSTFWNDSWVQTFDSNTYLWTRCERNLIFDRGCRLLDIYRQSLLSLTEVT